MHYKRHYQKIIPYVIGALGLAAISITIAKKIRNKKLEEITDSEEYIGIGA